MGVSRLLLALGVVGDHTDFFILLGSYSAVGLLRAERVYMSLIFPAR